MYAATFREMGGRMGGREETRMGGRQGERWFGTVYSPVGG